MVNQIADKCLRVLANHEANPEFAQMIHAARADSIEAIHTASVNNHIAVRSALEAALEDEEPATDDGSETPFGLSDTN